MGDVTSADPNIQRGVGATVTGAGGALSAVGTAINIFPVAALAPIFGVVGAQFLGASAAAFAKQAVSVGTLGSNVAESGVWTSVSGNTFEDFDNSSATTYNATADGFGA